MTGIPDLLAQARSLGARFELQGDKVKVKAPAPLPSPLMDALRQHKAEIMAYLSQRQKEAKPSPGLDPALCRNPLTPHSAHEFPWECDPDTCLCYRKFGYPRLCQGVPCRWVWPNGVPKATANA